MKTQNFIFLEDTIFLKYKGAQLRVNTTLKDLKKANKTHEI
jgi:hypothetical protein